MARNTTSTIRAPMNAGRSRVSPVKELNRALGCSQRCQGNFGSPHSPGPRPTVPPDVNSIRLATCPKLVLLYPLSALLPVYELICIVRKPSCIYISGQRGFLPVVSLGSSFQFPPTNRKPPLLPHQWRRSPIGMQDPVPRRRVRKNISDSSMAFSEWLLRVNDWLTSLGPLQRFSALVTPSSVM